MSVQQLLCSEVLEISGLGANQAKAQTRGGVEMTTTSLFSQVGGESSGLGVSVRALRSIADPPFMPALGAIGEEVYRPEA